MAKDAFNYPPKFFFRNFHSRPGESKIFFRNFFGAFNILFTLEAAEELVEVLACTEERRPHTADITNLLGQMDTQLEYYRDDEDDERSPAPTNGEDNAPGRSVTFFVTLNVPMASDLLDIFQEYAKRAKLSSTMYMLMTQIDGQLEYYRRNPEYQESEEDDRSRTRKSY